MFYISRRGLFSVREDFHHFIDLLLSRIAYEYMGRTIFIDSYSQLRQVREIMTSRISVLLMDLIKPNNAGIASCLVAINPNDDHIRRVLHLTLSRAMESLLASRCFSVELNLNSSVRQWCKSVLEIDCNVAGGRLVITNGDAAEDCCEVDDRKMCILCFPRWAFTKIRYLIQRRRRYDDTKVKFESSSLVLCTKSDQLRQHSEAVQLTNGERIIMKNTNAVTMATQTLNTSTTSLQSDMSVEEVEDAADNDVIRRHDVDQPHDVIYDERGGYHEANGHQNPSFVEENDADITYSRNPPQAGHTLHGGVTNTAYVDNEDPKGPDGKGRHGIIHQPGKTTGNSSKKAKTVMFQQAMVVSYPNKDFERGSELDAVAQANTGASDTGEMSTSSNNFFTSESSQDPKEVNVQPSSADDDEIPSPRSAFLARPDTPFKPRVKPRQSLVTQLESPRGGKSAQDNNTAVSSSKKEEAKLTDKDGNVVNDKIAKRQRKIGLLLRDLVLSSTSAIKSKFSDDEECQDGLTDAKNGIFANSNLRPERPSRVKQTPVKGWNSETDKIFPYTSDLLSFPAMSPATTDAALEKYGAKMKKGKKKKAASKTEDMLFRPRLNLDAFGPDRNCFSDQDVADSDITDLETEPENAVSDTEGITSSRLIPVQNTTRTISMDSVNNKSDVDTDLEITDCEVEEEELARKLRAPRILPGALAAQELRGSSARARSAASRDYIPPSAQARRRGGNQNDSRRRYLALNSLRRKAYKLALQSQVRSQKKTPEPELVSYNTRAANIAIISQV